jgi:protein involved in polysaccharide export with SLBB domain
MNTAPWGWRWGSRSRDAGVCALAVGMLTISSLHTLWAQAPTHDTLARPERPHGAVRPGDEIRVRIWREPELSGEFQVDETGVVAFPKLGRMHVTAEQPASLKERLVRAYSVYLVNPSIEVQVRRRINVLGAVKNPGIYEVDPTMTIADALAVAGGTTSLGRASQVELRRQGASGPIRLSGRVLIGDSPIQSGDQLLVPERSWLSRNPAVIIGAIGLVSTVMWRVTQ